MKNLALAVCLGLAAGSGIGCRTADHQASVTTGGSGGGIGGAPVGPGLPIAAGVTAGYAGWDTTTLKGHITGHFLSAASRMAVATGDTSYTTKVSYLVQELG